LKQLQSGTPEFDYLILAQLGLEMEKMLKQIEMGLDTQKKLCRDGRRWKYGGWNLESSGVLESPSEKQTKEEIRSGNPINLRSMKGLKVTNSLVDSYGRS
jgi:hypothetical protein